MANGDKQKQNNQLNHSVLNIVIPKMYIYRWDCIIYGIYHWKTADADSKKKKKKSL